MKKDLSKGISILFFTVIILLVFIDNNYKVNNESKTQIKIEEEIHEYKENIIKSKEILVNNTLKKIEKNKLNDDILHEIYVTILPPKSKYGFSFTSLNSQLYSTEEGYILDNNDPYVEVSVKYETPDKSNDSLELPNATMELRGQSSRKAPQKSYKIKLLEGTKLWNGFEIINLNKHFADKSRISNKISFDFLNEMDNIVAVETYFVRLYICDKSENIENTVFEDFGLYTFVEQPNKRFLKRNGLDKNGSLYKAEYFEFYRYENAIKLFNDYTFNMEEFEGHLEVMGSNDHRDLIKMIDAVNNYNFDINDVIETHFDRENILTWMAACILFDNYDNQSRNFMLYSGVDSDKWEIIPWDCDSGWSGNFEKSSKWVTGVSNYWGMVIFNRFLKDENNRNDLTNKIIELMKIINEETVSEKTEKYYKMIEPVIFASQDKQYVEKFRNPYKNIINNMSIMPKKHFEIYLKSLENPLPFYLSKPYETEDGYVFEWNPAYDFQHDNITYRFELSKDVKFKKNNIRNEELTYTSITVDELDPGTYYWKVRAFDESGNWQDSFEKTTYNNRKYFGIMEFIINEENINE